MWGVGGQQASFGKLAGRGGQAGEERAGPFVAWVGIETAVTAGWLLTTGTTVRQGSVWR